MKKAILYIILMVITSAVFSQNIYVVTKTTDPNPFDHKFNNDDNLCDPEMYGTLQWAINKVNYNEGESRIEFNIPGSGIHEITSNSYLPQIKRPVVIDGTTQPGYTTGNPVIKITGQMKTQYGFNAYNTTVTIKGLEISNFARSAIMLTECIHSKIIDNKIYNISFSGGYGIHILASNYTEICGNRIEIDALPEYGRSSVGIYVDKTEYCIIGGTESGKANTIANCQKVGVVINGDKYNKVSGNAIYNNPNAILLGPSANNNIQRPTITHYTNGVLKGTSLPNSIIEVFGSTGSENANEYLVSTIANENGDWSVEVSTEFEYYVGILTDFENNTSTLSLPLINTIIENGNTCSNAITLNVDTILQQQQHVFTNVEMWFAFQAQKDSCLIYFSEVNNSQEINIETISIFQNNCSNLFSLHDYNYTDSLEVLLVGLTIGEEYKVKISKNTSEISNFNIHYRYLNLKSKAPCSVECPNLIRNPNFDIVIPNPDYESPFAYGHVCGWYAALGSPQLFSFPDNHAYLWTQNDGELKSESIFTNVNVCVGETYTLGYRYRRSTSNITSFVILLANPSSFDLNPYYYGGAAPVPIFNNVKVFTIDDVSNDWQNDQIEFIADDNYTRLVIYPVTNSSTIQELRIDDIYLERTKANLGEDFTICQGESGQISALGCSNHAYSWSPSSGLNSSNSPVVMASPNTTTTYTVVVEDNYGCTASDQIEVIVKPSPNINLTAQTNQICVGEETVIIANASGGVLPYTYSWSNNPLWPPNFNVQTVTPTNSTTYTVTVTGNNGCTASDDVLVEVASQPIINISAENSNCTNSFINIDLVINGGNPPFNFVWNNWSTSQNLSNVPSGNYIVTITDNYDCVYHSYISYNFSPLEISNLFIQHACSAVNNGEIQISVENGIAPYSFEWTSSTGFMSNASHITGLSPGTYYVTITDNTGCEIIETYIIEGSSIALTTSSSNPVLCIDGGESSIISVEAIDGVEPYTYNWNNGLGGANTHTVSPNITTTYTVTVTDAIGCTETAEITVTVIDLDLIIKHPEHEICVGESVELDAHADGIGITYSWSPTANLDNPNSQFPIATPTETTLYTVTATDINGCSTTGTVLVTVYPLPIITVSGPNETCEGYEEQLEALGALTYLWEPSTGLSDPNISNPIAVLSETTTYIVSGWDEHECKGFTTFTINVLENPVPIIDYDDPVCLDDNLEINITNIDANAHYHWEGPNGFTTDQPNIVINNVTNLNQGLYSVTVTHENGCTATNSIYVTVHSFVAHAGNHSHCVGDELVLFARPSGLVSYHWEGPNGYNATYDVYEHHIPNASLDMSGTYYVTITDQYGCTASAQTTVVVHDNPIVNLGDDILICLSESVLLGQSLSISGGSPSYSYEWEPIDWLSNPLIANPTATPEATTTYTLTVSDTYACSGSDAITVTVDQIIGLTATYNDPVCQYTQLQLFAQPDGLEYQWTGPAGFTSTEQNPIVTDVAGINYSGTYTLTATNANTCISSVSIEVVVHPVPDVFTSAPQTICEGDELTLQGGPDGMQEYHWIGPNGYLSNLQNSTVSTTANTNMQGNYTLTAISEFGCSASAVTNIEVIPIPQNASYALPSCIYIFNDYQFTNLGNNDASFDYTWNFGDGIVSNEATPIHEFRSEGYHCITLTVENQCDISTYSTEPLFLYPNECACITEYDVEDNLPITGSNEYWNPAYSTVKKDIIIESGAKLTVTNQTIEFGPEGRIIVKQGGELIITKSSTLRGLESCENMWQGVEVWGDHMSNPDDVIQGHVEIYEGSNTIRDAHIGILAGARNMDNICNFNLLLAFNSDYSGGYIFNKEKLNFINNGIGIKLLKKHPGYEGTGSHVGYQTMHFFTETGGFLNDNNYNSVSGTNPYPNRHNPWAGKANNLQRTDVGIWMENQKLTKLTYSTFTNLQYGILAYNSYFNVIRTNFDNAVYGIRIDNSNSSLDSGHEIVGCNFTNIKGTGDDDFEDITSAGIFINSSLNAKIHGNVFGGQNSQQYENNIGIYTFNSLSMNINQNRFEGMKKGIFIGNLIFGVVGPFGIWQPVTDLPTNKIGAVLSSYYDISGLGDWDGNTFIKCNTSIYTFLTNNNLVLKCNNCNNDDINPGAYYVNFQNEGIMANIGAPALQYNLFNLNLKRPGGNEFMPDNQAAQGFYKTIMTNNEYEYYAHQGPSRVIPTSHTDSEIDMENEYHIHTSTYQKPENSIACSPLFQIPIPIPIIEINPLTGAKNYPYKHLDSLKNQIDSLLFIKEELILNLDNSKTQELLNDIYGNTNQGRLKNKLIANSPLSDTVLYALMSEYPLSHGNFKNVMTINLPVSTNLTSLFSGVMNQIPTGISKQLIPLQGVNFNYPNITSTNREIEHLKLERGYVLNQLLNHLTDSVNNRRDDALLLLELEGTDWAKATLVASYIADEEYDIAREKLSQIQSNDPLAQDYIDYQNMMLDIYEDNRTIYQMDSSEITFIRELAYKCPAGIASTNAQAILSLLYRENVPICPMMVGTRSISDNSNNTIFDDRYNKPIQEIILGDNYPDPASDYTIIPYYLPEETNGILEIYDAMGKIVTVFTLHQGDNQLNIDTKELQPGIYTYTLITNEYETMSKKFIIYR